MIKILFVCHGNICRSPMAEFIMKDLVLETGLGSEFEISSAATSTEEIGNPIYPPAQEKLIEHGIHFTKTAARQMTKKDYDYYDHIVVMDDENLREMTPFVGKDPKHKVSRLLDHTKRGGNVADPWYTRDFDAAYHDIDEGCRGLLKSLIDMAING